jgi:formylmethanofuran dehydrogenase subunit C
VSVRLKLRAAPLVRLDASCVRPDAVATLSEAEIARLAVWHGREEARLGDFFDVEGGASDDVRISGDLHRITHVGAAMSGGTSQPSHTAKESRNWMCRESRI